MVWLYVLVGLVVVYFISSKNNSRSKKKSKLKSHPKADISTHNNKRHPLEKGFKQRFENIKEFCNMTDIVFIDTETTGLTENDQIIEIAVVDFNGNILLDSLVKPTVKVNPKAKAKHGIADKELKNAPLWPDVYKQYLTATEGKTILAYNSKYDKKMVQQTCKANNLTNKKRQWNCVMLAYSEFMGYKKYDSYTWHKLEIAAFNCGVKIDGQATQRHRAVFDAGMALGVYLYMQREVNRLVNTNKPNT